MSVTEFLKGLPSYNENNFTKFQTDNNKSSLKRPSVYIPTRDCHSQIIVTEKTTILLRYMQQRWDKKTSLPKREESTLEESSRKRPRLPV